MRLFSNRIFNPGTVKGCFALAQHDCSLANVIPSTTNVILRERATEESRYSKEMHKMPPDCEIG